MGIQKSHYLKIEEDIEVLRSQYNRLKGNLLQNEHEDFDSFKIWKGILDLRFCHEVDVHRKNYMFLLFKASFLQKMRNLQIQGQSIRLKWRLYGWIEENANKICKSNKMRKITVHNRDHDNYHDNKPKFLKSKSMRSKSSSNGNN